MTSKMAEDKTALINRDDWGHRVRAFSLRYLLTCISSTVAESITFPIDITKTRLQIQQQKLGTAGYRGAVQTAIGIVREEGFFKLWKGLTPAILRHYVYSSRMVFYEYLRDHVFGKNKDGSFDLWKSILCGMTSGGAAQMLASPTDLVKVRLQMDGRRELEGLEPRYKGTAHAFRSIVREHGVRGLWRGAVPNSQRAALACLGDATTYDTVKRFLLIHMSFNDNTLTHSLASLCSGFVATIFSTPADVVKSRMMNQPFDRDGRGVLYRSSWQCLRTAVRNEGFSSLYRGFFPTWTRLGPWSMTFWITLEQIRILAGISTF